ncbi:resuscitation-promoting factor [Streptomyces sp. 150FB]|uniref:resuscitation-promoting factor n=1 Tax=Streptomyces sp. 150FB TaxID=1576605 RepID=UPI000AB9AB61|nr:resuscitation-promoting factor [Streptomyces sp. 150FB]
MSHSQGSHRAVRGGRHGARTAEPPPYEQPLYQPYGEYEAPGSHEPYPPYAGPSGYEPNPYQSNPYQQGNPYQSNPYQQNSAHQQNSPYQQSLYQQNPYQQNPYQPYVAPAPFLPRQQGTAGAAPFIGHPVVAPPVMSPPVVAPPVIPPVISPSGHASSRRRTPAPSPEALRRLVPQALVVAFLAGGTSAFVASDKAVELNVDGVPRTLHTFADGVDELLAEEGVSIGAHDVVTPGHGDDLSDGDTVAVGYGRPLRLTLDGRHQLVWTTARTVEGALRQFGVRVEGAFVSVPRASAIARSGLALDVRTERSVTFMADGGEHTVRTNVATVAEALTRAGIVLGAQDTTSVGLGSFPRDGQTITVMRITAHEVVRDEPIPYDTVRTRDSSLFQGTEVVVRQGARGVRRVTYSLRTVNGVKQKPRELRGEVVRQPVTERISVGTRVRPTSVAGADGLNWSGLAVCESGGRAGAVDASGNYGGLYQFDTGTWRALGGSGRPQDASGQEQTFRAKKLYVQRGASPWPHCGRRLTG